MTVKCQNVVKCELQLHSRYQIVQNFSECNNCVASFETAKRKIKTVRINLKSTFFIYNAVEVGNVFQRHSKNFKTKSLASKYLLYSTLWQIIPA